MAEKINNIETFANGIKPLHVILGFVVFIVVTTVSATVSIVSFNHKIEMLMPVVPEVKEVKQAINDFKTEQKTQGEKIDKLTNQMEGFKSSYKDLLHIIPQVTKDNMEQLLLPLYEVEKKNKSQTQLNSDNNSGLKNITQS